MKSSKKLIFFGNERLATGVDTSAPVLNSLIKNGYEIAAVVSHYTTATSRSARPLEIAEVAKNHDIPLLLPEKLSEVKAELKSYNAAAAVLVAFGRIIPPDVIDIFPKGIINIHPSLLPKLRGPTPIESTILSGESETGVSLMKLAAKMDAGPVYALEKISLSGNETKQGLADNLSKLGADLLIKNLPDILEGVLESKSQDEERATYTALLDKNLSNIDLSLPAMIIERQVRAYSVWPKSRTKINGQDIVVTKARVITEDNRSELTLKTSDGYLLLETLIAPSGRKMSGADFLRGYAKIN